MNKKIVLITGAAAGIGAALARHLGESGWCVAIADIREQAAQSTAEQLRSDGIDAFAIGADVGDPDSVTQLVATVCETAGRIDALVNNAGIESCAPFLEIDLATFERVMRINTTSIWLCSQAVIPLMIEQGGGSIVNVSSVAGQRGGGILGTAAYSTSKGAVIALTKALAREFARSNIRINAVAPAMTMTDFVERQLAQRGPDTLAQAVAATPMGRSASPAEIAAVIAFLVSSQASFVTGHVYNVDGGIAM